MSLHISLVRANNPAMIAMVRERCEEDHYLHRWPDPRSLPFAYVVQVNGNSHAEDGRINGLLVLKKLQHHKQRNLFGYPGLPTAWQVLDLARVWIHPQWQTPGVNLFSRAVSQVLKRVQRDWLDHHPPRFPDRPYHVEIVVSYADNRFHKGTAYKACNFQEWGQSDGKTLYIYRLPPPRWAWQPTMIWGGLPLFGALA